jgi:prepilin-type N-terminal cleavage/methylation domain-containing protein
MIAGSNIVPEPAPVGGADNTRPGDGGFTLIEVLVSLTILSVSLAVVMAVFGNSLLRSREAQSRMEARRLATGLLAEAQNEANLRVGETRGRDGAGLVWDLRVQTYGSPDDNQAWIAHAVQIRATVSWGEGREGQSVSLATLRVLPKEISP